MPATETESSEFRWGNVTTCPCGSTNIERQTADEGRPFSCNNCGLEFFKDQGFASGDFPDADQSAAFLATAALEAGWSDEQITVNRGRDILYMPGDFYWLHLIEDDDANVVVPVSPELIEDVIEPERLKVAIGDMARGAFASLRSEAAA